MSLYKGHTYILSLTIEGVISWVHLAEFGHVCDRIATGGGGANTRLASDAQTFQSVERQAVFVCLTVQHRLFQTTSKPLLEKKTTFSISHNGHLEM